MSEHVREYNNAASLDKGNGNKCSNAGKEGRHSHGNKNSQELGNMIKALREVLIQEREYVFTENLEEYLALMSRKESLIQAINDTIADCWNEIRSEEIG